MGRSGCSRRSAHRNARPGVLRRQKQTPSTYHLYSHNAQHPLRSKYTKKPQETNLLVIKNTRLKRVFPIQTNKSRQHSCPDCAINRFHVFQRLLGVIRFNINHHITNIDRGLQILCGNVDTLFCKDMVDLV